jgi:lipopolysaccharide/colanic/teichoic acid biosynthesis glycosyltransferase
MRNELLRVHIESQHPYEAANAMEAVMAFNVSLSFGRSRESDAAILLPTPPGQLSPPRRVLRSAGLRRGLDNARVREPSLLLRAAKRTVDILGSGFGLLVFAPLLIGIAVTIKLTSAGPVFFRQKRYGYHNRRFWIFKFRTMYTHLGDQSGTQQTTTGDSRVTPIGRFLRKTSLDELPQLINVLKGDMSLVGPRPHVPGMLAGGMLYEELVPYYFQRHNMRPGITGLAQVSGFRGSTTVPASAIDRLDFDLQYIQRWSLGLDITIILRTVTREFISGSGG